MGRHGSGHMTNHEHEPEPERDDSAALRAAADLLDRLLADLDPPGQLDIRDKEAGWKLRRAAELARERAAEVERSEGEADCGE